MRELKDCNEEEVAKELKEQGVTGVRKMIRGTGENREVAGTVVLSFNMLERPKKERKNKV